MIMRKLRNTGVSGKMENGLSNIEFLQHRNEQVLVNKEIKKSQVTSCAVKSRSVLGPLPGLHKLI